MSRVAAAATLALASLFFLGAVPVAKIQSLIARPKVLCGRFDQTKELIGLKKPVLSDGRFCVVAGKGVLWRTVHPFASTLKLTRDEIIQTRGDRVAGRLDAKQEPGVRTINSVLFAALAGNLDQLESHFEIDGALRDDRRWSAALKPRDAGLAKAIGAISLEGGAYVEKVEIAEASGDRTKIVFSAIETGEAAMSADEAALF